MSANTTNKPTDLPEPLTEREAAQLLAALIGKPYDYALAALRKQVAANADSTAELRNGGWW